MEAEAKEKKEKRKKERLKEGERHENDIHTKIFSRLSFGQGENSTSPRDHRPLPIPTSFHRREEVRGGRRRGRGKGA